MSVNRATSVFRERSRALPDGSLGSSSDTTTAHADNGDVDINGPSFDAQVQPGTRVDGSYIIDINPDLFSRFWDRDHCDLGWAQVGFDLRGELWFDGELVETWSDCTGSNKEYNFELYAPQQVGDYPVTVKVYGAGSNNKVGEQTATLTVTEDDTGGVEPGDPTDDGGGLFDTLLGALFGTGTDDANQTLRLVAIVLGILLLMNFAPE